MTAPVYHGFAAPVGPDWKPVNGARGRRRDPRKPIQFGVIHLWVSPEDGPDRYLQHLATPALPSTGRAFQSRTGTNGSWLWESLAGTPTTNPAIAKKYTGRATLVYRSKSAPLPLNPGDPMPWCYGAGYHSIAGIDGRYHWAANPDVHAVNHAPPWNDEAVSICLPGRYQSAAEWMDATSKAELEATAQLIVDANRRWAIPMRHIDPARIRAGQRGWAGHADVNAVFHLSDHGDPGSSFPWAYLFGRVAALDASTVTDPTLVAAIVTFWGWGTVQAAQAKLNVPPTGVWDSATAAAYTTFIEFLRSLKR